jgi:hypothetical protein
MSMADRYQQNLEQAVGRRIDGPLVVATIGSPVGSMANLFKAEAFNVGMSAMGSTGSRASGSTAGRIHHRDAKDVRLPRSFAVALTATSVYFFQWKPFWGRVKIKKELTRVPRDGLAVQVSHGQASATVFLLVSERAGTQVAFEMATLGMGKAKEKVAEVVAAFAPETV